MAFSGSIGVATFNALKVIDHAFRRCKLPAQQITSEMQQYALESLAFMLSEIANGKTPSWCIEKQIYPFYQGQPTVVLDLGTVEVLNANYRTMQQITGTVTTLSSTEYKTEFSSATAVSTVGVKWSGAAVNLTFDVSDDDISWTTVGTQTTTASAGEWTWSDITPAIAYKFFRITGDAALDYSQVYLANMPQEIPMGSLNRDTFVAQSNKIFEGRPLTYWFQRDIPEPVLHLWPAPNAAAEYAQLIVWRHRQIMDTENLQQEVEIPHRWLEAIINGLAARVGSETQQVDINLIPVLEQRAAQSMQRALDGDNDGSPTYINPGIGCYTK